MRSFRHLCTLILFLIALSTSDAQVPRTISFQGILTDANGVFVADGAHALRLAIYDTQTGGTALHVETQNVTVVKGVFNAIIGASGGISTSLSFDRAYFLGVSVDGGAELEPRTPLTAAPYAIRAELAALADSAANAARAAVADVANGVSSTASGVVTSLNGRTGAVSIAGSGGTSVSVSGDSVIIGASAGGGLSLPFAGSSSVGGDAFAITNAGLGTAGLFTVTNGGSSNSALVAAHLGLGSAIFGRVGTGTGGTLTSVPAIRGENSAGTGVAGLSTTGTGVFASATTGTGLSATSMSRAIYATATGTTTTAYGVYAQSTSPGGVGVYGLASAGGTINQGVSGETQSTASGTGALTGSSGVLGSASNVSSGAWSAGVRGVNMGSTTNSNGVIGYAAFSGKGVYGESVGGVGVHGRGSTGKGVEAYVNGTGNALWVQHDGAGASTTTNNNLAIYNANGLNVARIDRNGKGYFNGGTQTSGADIAEAFDVAGDRAVYEPGDVLVISTTAARTVERASTPYSTLVAGVYATKPGMLLSERDIEADHADRVPMGVVGVLPTKVTTENGPIKIGDLLVTSSTTGHAMRADPLIARDHPGCVLGKALESYDGDGAGSILVLVSVK